MSSPPGPTPEEGCIVSLGAIMDLHLNASALSSPNSLTLNLSSDSIPNTRIHTLLDSGSTHCFLDTSFVSDYKLRTSDIGPIPLQLFDGSSNSEIQHSVDLSIRFPTGEQHSVMFFVTPLDASCNTVLGHNWLTRYNPLIDWVLSSITFRTPKPADVLANPKTLALAPISSDPPTLTPLVSPHIALVNAAFAHISNWMTRKLFNYSSL